MNLLKIFKVTESGLSAQKTRLNIATTNIANSQVTRTMEGGPYKAKIVVLKAVPLSKDDKNLKII